MDMLFTEYYTSYVHNKIWLIMYTVIYSDRYKVSALNIFYRSKVFEGKFYHFSLAAANISLSHYQVMSIITGNKKV